MDRFAKGVAKHRRIIVAVALLLMIPSAIGYMHTRVNYDLLAYLPDDIDTVEGQHILLDDFGKGSFALIAFEGMEDRDVAKAKEKIEKLDYVDSVIWYDSLADISIPKEMLPDDIYEAFNNDECTLMAAFMNVTISSDEAIQTIDDMRNIAGKQAYISSLSAFVTDLKYIGDHEEPIYILIAVLLSALVMSIFLDSFLLPWIFILSLGIAIIINMGSNIVFGEISYITKAISAVLQLGVTMDYSIFLWNAFKEEKQYIDNREEAMSIAIRKTMTAVSASSITTIAGFIALCFMSFTLGVDLGLVMAKGVVLGLISAVTLLPSFILMCEKWIEKTSHKPLSIANEKIASFVLNNRKIFAVLFVLILIPALFGYLNTTKYYDLDQSIPETTGCREAQIEIEKEFGLNQVHMLLCDSEMGRKDSIEMMDRIENVDGVMAVLGKSTILGDTIPEEILPESIGGMLSSNGRQLMIITSEYRVATDEINRQIDTINEIVDEYDINAILIGESACTKDLIKITDNDFRVVTIISVLAILAIIAISLGSAVLPFILVAVIELAIFINLGIPYYTGNEVAFIMPICVSTIQLGATVDYAILMTTRYRSERTGGQAKYGAVKTALATSIPSIVVSALGFFAATFGVGMYSDIDLVASMCILMARGAVISMITVIIVLPAFLYIFDSLIIKGTRGMKRRKEGERL